MATTIEQWLEDVAQGYTNEELHVAWLAVRPAGSWKGPIDQHIPASLALAEDLVRTAILFYTGSAASFVHDGEGGYQVAADGYRATMKGLGNG